MYDLIIQGATVLDGTGAAPMVADVGVRDERIAAVGALEAAEARAWLPAAGLHLCPGFIDVHSHSDTYLLLEPGAESKITQGVTTEVAGNCGASAAPRLGAAQMPSDWREQAYPGAWRTVAEYRRLLEQVRPAVNLALLVGHNTLRAGVMGYEARAARPDEIRAMCANLEQALEEGAAGLSTGLIYSPGMFAGAEEVTELARVAAQRQRIYTSHMRSEGARILEALDEVLAVGRQAGVRLEVSHLKTSGRPNWGRLEAALDKLEAARADGFEGAADRYPYTAACTDLDVILPDWAAGGGLEAVLQRLRDPAVRERLRAEIARERDPEYWNIVRVGTTWRPEHRRWQGMPLTAVAAELNLAPVDAALYLMDRDELHTGAIFFGMSEDNMWRILARPWVMLGSDASLRATTGPLSADHPHPRAYGTFPRFLRAALDGRTVPLTEAVRKMTALPAAHFRLRDRGLIKPGLAADLVVYDPRTVTDCATFEQPHQTARGICHVLVNGAWTIRDGRATGARGGRFLE